MRGEKLIPYNLRLPGKLKTKLEKQARESNRSLNQQIVYLLGMIADIKPDAPKLTV